jgi:flagellar hook assembly protein FlgD
MTDRGDDVFRAYSNPIWMTFDGTSVAESGSGSSLSVSLARNPSRGEAAFELVLPAPRTARLSIYDVSGRLVRSIETGRLPAGPLSVAWDGADSNGRPVASGVYLARLGSSTEAATTKFVLLR